jgi:hypothetical protein
MMRVLATPWLMSAMSYWQTSGYPCWRSNNEERKMYWEAISAVAELAGALGVIASLIYLARQIRQSNASDRMNTTLNLQSSYNEVGSLFLRDAETMSKGFAGLATLTDEEGAKFSVFFHLYFGHVELVHSYEKQGMLDNETLKRTYGAMRFYLQLQGVQDWWNEAGRVTFSDDFVKFAEAQETLGSDLSHTWGR